MRKLTVKQSAKTGDSGTTQKRGRKKGQATLQETEKTELSVVWSCCFAAMAASLGGLRAGHGTVTDELCRRY